MFLFFRIYFALQLSFFLKFIFINYFFQLQIVATKTDVGVQQATATVNITVNRNLADPVFEQNGFFSKTIEETQILGTEVIKVAATDADQDMLVYEMENKSPHNEYFIINSKTGSIILVKSLLGSVVGNFSVSQVSLNLFLLQAIKCRCAY